MTKKNQKPKTKNQKLKTKKRSRSLQKPQSSKPPAKPKVARTLKSPQTMEELIALYGEKIRGFRRGEEVEGKVTAITNKNIYFDIGGKTEGVVLGREFEACQEFIRTLRVGMKVRLRVGNPENERGQILLSLRQTAQNFAWNFFEEKLRSQEEVEVRGRELNKGGLIVATPFNLQGFVPGSQLGSMWQGRQGSLINRVLKVKVIEVDREENRLVFSERLVSEAKKIAAEKKALKKIRIGQAYEGEVVQVLPYGLMVEIKVADEKGGDASTVPGLVHISEVSWAKVENLGKLYQEGDKVKAKAIKIEDDKLQLSLKQLLPDPWQDLEKKYPLEVSVKGTVKRLAAYGALVELEPGIEGLLHISKIPPDYQISVGDQIACFIESIDQENRKLSLDLVLKKKPVGYK